MASNSAERIVLLPIRPRFARSIMTGEKKVEFRKVRFRNEVSHVVVYASSPIQKILGYFEVSYMDQGSPKELWTRYNVEGKIFQDEFEAYYASSTRAIAIGIGNIYPLRNPVPLRRLGQSLTAPQGFMYLADEAFEIIRRYC